MSITYINPYSIDQIVTDGLVLNLDAGNSTSYPGTGTTWTDLISSANNATLANGPTFNSANGGAIVFDGVDDRANITYNATTFLIGTGDFTMNFWYNRTVTSLYAEIFTLDIYNNPGCLVVGPGANQQNKVEVIIGQFQSINASVTQSANTWYNMTVRRLSGQASIFMNSNILTLGSGGTSASMPSSINSTVNPIIAKSAFNGRVAIVQLYKGIALSNAQILQNFNALRGRFGV